jgi:hypothetical protein
MSKASDEEARIPNPQTGILEGETWVPAVQEPGSRNLNLEFRSRTQELGSEIQELESLLVQELEFRNQEGGSQIRELGSGVRNWIQSPGTGAENHGSALKRLGIGIPNPRTNLNHTDYRELAPGPRNWYLGPRELGSRIQKPESRGLEKAGIPEPRYCNTFAKNLGF